MVLRLGLIVNPVAGIGGPAALKGSDGVVDDAIARGYAPTAAAKATRFLTRLKARAGPTDIRIFAAPGVMGGGIARDAGWKVGTLGAETMTNDALSTDAYDTEEACRYALDAEMDLIVFIGGDGTARDVARVVGTERPILGVPAGVKMFSECFAETPEAAADLVAELARQPDGTPIETENADILDLDEDAYRAGEMKVLHHDAARVPRSPRIQNAKCPACPPAGLDGAIGEVRLRMQDEPNGLYILGSGSTMYALKQSLGLDGALIGIDVVTAQDPEADDVDWWELAKDADARRIDELVREAGETGRKVTIIVSPIGGQGFVVGRGTGQLSPQTIRATLPDRFWVVATPGKLDSIEAGTLRVDTGDPELDETFPSFVRVIVGLEREKMVRVARA